MNEAPTSPSRRGRGTRIAAASALIIAVAAAVYLVLVSGSNGDRKASGDSRVSYTGAATVQRRNLVEEDTESGTLGHPRSYTVYNRVSGTITWLPSAGDVIKPGQTLFRVDNKPVLLMNGSTPAYRDLSSSDGPGPDILELNANLVALGYNPDGIVVDDKWQAATTAGVKELQDHLGEGQSGKIVLGKVVFLPGKQLVSSVAGTVGSTVSLTDPSSHAEFVSLDTTPTDSTPAADTTDTTPATTTTPPATTSTTTAATTPPTTTTPATTTSTDTTPATTTAPPATTTTTPPATTSTTTAPGTTTTPKTHTNTTPASKTQTGTTPSHTPSSHSGSPGGSDNLSSATLRALLQLVREQQRALAQEHSGSPSHNGQPSSSSHQPSSSSHKPSSSSHKPSSSSHKPSSSSHQPSSSSHQPSSSSHQPSSSSHNPSSSSKSPSNGSNSPSASGAGTAIMDTTSTQLVVTVDLSPSSQSEAVVGGHVTVEMPNGSSVPGTIKSVSSVAQSPSGGGGGNTGNTGSGGGGSSSVPVTITLDKPVSGKGLDQAAVSVKFVQARANHVLSVPVTALLATSGNTYAVQEAAAPHKLIPVTTGMFAAGYVQISGPGIHPGLRVTDSQG